MGVDVIVNQIIVLFLLMGLGYCLVKYKVLDKATCDKLTWLLCYVVMPCLIFNAFQIPFTDELWHNFVLMAGLTFGIHFLYILLSKILLNNRHLKKRSLAEQMQFTAVYSNCGFMGLPLVMALVGSAGAFYGSVYIAVNGLFVWTHGLLTYSGRFDRRSLLKVALNPNTIASIVGCLFFVFSIHLPTPVHSAIGHVGTMNTALSMILVGAAMAQVEIRKIWLNSYAWISVFMRNLLFPGIVLIGLFSLNIQGNLLIIAMALSACPVAGMSVLFAQLTGKDTDFPCKSLTLSTIASLVTLPLMLALASL
ncbi:MULTISPECIES: AEC family transporter [Vibrio]|uniref:AEC family transporter n=2 Tax=Vibrio TaxID=662 RepID=A0A7X4RUR4_9VIBR|nr:MULTISPECIES: AEC family transporter [Vibrio]MBF9002209.1 AEC family transporter [Vibrio nitrifigilis]MZI94131.1 hypothetical protein [Vibrio eleionomae]